jgi:hypothetical protein
MKYTEDQVLDILRLVTDQPEVILNKWSNQKDNEPLDLKKYSYPLFLLTFPIIVNDEEVATMTLAQLQNTGVDGQRDRLMSKYLTTNTYNMSWHGFSHETYKDAFFHISKEFELPAHPEDDNFRVIHSSFLDADGKEVKYRMSYGDSDVYGLHTSYVSERGEWRSYRFDNGVTIQIEATDFSGWEMGEKINEVIKVRVRDQKIDLVTNE